jgi:hypothetical protein
MGEGVYSILNQIWQKLQLYDRVTVFTGQQLPVMSMWIHVQSTRVGKGIFVSCEWSIFVCVKCEMLDFSVVKCDLFYSCEACLSIKMLSEMRIKNVCFVNCDFALFISIYLMTFLLFCAQSPAELYWIHVIRSDVKIFRKLSSAQAFNDSLFLLDFDSILFILYCARMILLRISV